MYVLDRIDSDGTILGPALSEDGEPVGAVNHMSTARGNAVLSAALHGERVQISRVVGEFDRDCRPCLIVTPEGEARMPLHAEPMNRRERCTKDTGRACFCSPCRAARRAV